MNKGEPKHESANPYLPTPTRATQEYKDCSQMHKCLSFLFELAVDGEVTCALSEDVVEEFNEMLRSSRDMAASVAAVTVLANYIEHSKATTVMELEKELTSAAEKLER